jgi:Helix-turn-helix domain
MADYTDDTQKKGAVSDTAPIEPTKPLDANNTTAINQRAIILQALKIAPQTTITLRHEFGIMNVAPRIFELIAKSHSIESQRVDAETPDGVMHKRVALYILHASPPLTNNQPSDKNSEVTL